MQCNMSAAEIKFRLETEAGLSIAAFAAIIERHPSTVSMVIHRRRTSNPIMTKIAETLEAARSAQKQPSNDKEDAA
jgi:plasmid maintenance system antidote protein VapI